MKPELNDRAIETELTMRVRSFGEHIQSIIKEQNINILVPLESKGALLIDVACNIDSLPKSVNVIYPRALRYIHPDDIAGSKIMLVDDIFFSGRHLKDVYKRVQTYGADTTNIQCVAFLDFSSGERDCDYEGDMYDLIKQNILPGPALKRSETLLYLQSEMLAKTMPSVYDHLTIEANDVDQDAYFTLLAILSDKNRLLHYGQRGNFQASSILLDDLFTGDWDVPPKVRLWYQTERKVLRITPVGAISNTNKSGNCMFTAHLFKAIVDTVLAESQNERNEAEYEAHVLTGRLQQLISLKKVLWDLGMRFTLDKSHLERYYPALDVPQAVLEIFTKGAMTDLPSRRGNYEDEDYSTAVNAIINLNREAWESQPAKHRKDRSHNGYTASEIFNILQKYSIPALHAALDYCFDFHYLAVFRRQDQTGFSRCYRTTEIAGSYLPEEIYGAAIVYSLRGPTPDWLMNKVLPIVRSVTPNRISDERFLIAKAYFGDITRIKQSESSSHTWKDVKSELWDVKESGGGVHYIKKEDSTIKEKVETVLDDPRISGFRDTLAATIFLLENGGRNAGILLDILTPGYGGADYITHNIEKILSFGTRYPDHNADRNIELHAIGADEKINILLKLYEDDDNLITKLMRRSTRLQSSYLVQLQAEKVVKKARPFKSKTLYEVLKRLKSGISGGVMAVRNNDFRGLELAIKSIGIQCLVRGQDLRYVLTQAAQTVYPLLNAISGHIYYWKRYNEFLIKPEDKYLYILGYDLTGERRKVVAAGEELTRYDDELHKFIANWVIAFGGKLSTLGINAGDLRFGFFRTLDDAISAACWSLHHIEQLHHTGHYPIGTEAVGMVITRGDFHVDALCNSSGAVLDMSGHWLKGKIVERDEIDAASGTVGRKNTDFSESQLWLLEHAAFEVDRTKRAYIGSQRQLSYNNIVIDVAPVDFSSFIEAKKNPWIAH